MFLTFKYRLLPNKRQHAAPAAIRESQRQLYDAALNILRGAGNGPEAGNVIQVWDVRRPGNIQEAPARESKV